MKNIVILISGGGSNMAAIAKTAKNQNWAANLNAHVAAVISNRADASGLLWAKEQGISIANIDHKAFESREAFDQALMQQIDAFEPSLVVLAGFMRILTPEFVLHYAGRLINIHPSLLPYRCRLPIRRRNGAPRNRRAGCGADTGAGCGADIDHRLGRNLGGSGAVARAPVVP
jgi:phosphoribosylglycinamide formyltransferase 1